MKEHCMLSNWGKWLSSEICEAMLSCFLKELETNFLFPKSSRRKFSFEIFVSFHCHTSFVTTPLKRCRAKAKGWPAKKICVPAKFEVWQFPALFLSFFRWNFYFPVMNYTSSITDNCGKYSLPVSFSIHTENVQLSLCCGVVFGGGVLSICHDNHMKKMRGIHTNEG